MQKLVGWFYTVCHKPCENDNSSIRIARVEPCKTVARNIRIARVEPCKTVASNISIARVKPFKTVARNIRIARVEPCKTVARNISIARVKPCKTVARNISIARVKPCKTVASNIRKARVKPYKTVAILMLLSWLFFACSEAHEHIAPAVNPEDSVSMMTSYGVNTLISDSGVIKYRVVAERWEVNIARQPSRWEFMKGVFFEQFDEQFHVQGYIQADTAWYYDQIKLWKLRGRVSIRNVEGLIYKSEELFWDLQKHELYSHVFSRVITPERTIQGSYFRSDEHMEHYMVSNSKGSFLAEDMAGSKEEGGVDTSTFADSTQTEPQVRPAATHRAATRTNE